MRRGRLGRLAAVAAIGLICSSSASGATPSQIAADLADGKLDGTYTQAEMTAFLRNATVQGYEQPKVDVAPTAGVAGQTKVRQSPAAGPAGAAALRPGGRAALPFTGLDLALMTLGGFALVGLGAGMRRLARERS